MFSEKPSILQWVPETSSTIYTMIRTKLVPLITINYDLCSLTVLFSSASENNQRGITQPSGLPNLRSIFHSCLNRAPTVVCSWFMLSSAGPVRSYGFLYYCSVVYAVFYCWSCRAVTSHSVKPVWVCGIFNKQVSGCKDVAFTQPCFLSSEAKLYLSLTQSQQSALIAALLWKGADSLWSHVSWPAWGFRQRGGLFLPPQHPRKQTEQQKSQVEENLWCNFTLTFIYFSFLPRAFFSLFWLHEYVLFSFVFKNILKYTVYFML